MRQALLNGTLERLIDPDSYLRTGRFRSLFCVATLVLRRARNRAATPRVWFQKMLPQEEIAFDGDAYLLTQKREAA